MTQAITISSLKEARRAKLAQYNGYPVDLTLNAKDLRCTVIRVEPRESGWVVHFIPMAPHERVLGQRWNRAEPCLNPSMPDLARF